MKINTGIVKKHSQKGMGIKIVLFSAVVIAILLTVFIGFQTGLFYNDSSIVAFVNGEPVYVREFRKRLDVESIEVFEYYKKKYGIENSKKFWFSSYDGEIPAEVAKNKAFDEMVTIKIQQILAKEKGIINSVDYRDFLKTLEKENKTRENASKENKIIYGPDKYSEIGYFDYSFDVMVRELKKKLIQRELSIQEEELAQSYKLLKNTQFKIPDNIKIQKISISFVDDKDIISQQKKDFAKNGIEDVKNRLENGDDFEVVAGMFNSYGEILENSFKEEDYKNKDTRDNIVFIEAQKLEIGGISEIIEGNTDYSIIKCIDREERGFIPYEKAKVTIMDEILERDYESYIDNLVEDARIEKNNKIFSRVQVKY